MDYIVFDLEFNQDFSTGNRRRIRRSCFEIIQIGAVKLDKNLNTIDTFQRYVKPTIYPVINPFITELTGITTDQLITEETFPTVFKAFAEFARGSDTIFCIWGMADLKELYRNVEFHDLDKNLLSKWYINLQPYASLHFKLSQKKLMKLKTTAELLGIPLVYSFHNALYDAHYTAEIFKKINNESIHIKLYDPSFVAARPRPPKQKIDFEKLICQFEKMYDRELTEAEQDMISLAYKMGKTGQFLK